MSDDEADPELLALLRQSLGLGPGSSSAPPNTRVLESAEYVYDNAIDVSIVSGGTRAAADLVWRLMQEKKYSTETWSKHELHPKTKDESTVNFIFTMDLLNFCFWSDLLPGQKYAILYRGREWTGYWSLVAALQRALDEGIPITTPSYWAEASDESFAHVFRSATSEPIPLLAERITVLREASQVLAEHFDNAPANIIPHANHSAAALVNLLVEYFPSFNDQHTFHRKSVRFYKRAQIFVADLWACFNGTSYGTFDDISTALTMFADYTVPQVLQSLNVLWYSPRLESRIKRREQIISGETIEIEIRGCSIWAVELLRREIIKRHPEAEGKINAVLIDFFLYDASKEREKEGRQKVMGAETVKEEILPHHRTRSIWY